MVSKQTRLCSIIYLLFVLAFYSCKGPNSSKSVKSTGRTIGTTTAQFDGKASVIFQDKQNNFWFGGNEKGVYKYDGTHWMLFSKKEGLCSHVVLGIQEDKFGNLYFDTSEGVSKFDGQTFTTLEITKQDSSKNKWQLNSDDLWFRMGWDKKGPYRYDGQSLYYLEFPKPSLVDDFYAKYPNATFSPYGIYSMYKDRQGHVWFGTSSLGACRFDGKSIQWFYEEHLTETPSGGSFGIRAMLEDKNGHFWFCNTRYRYQISPDNISDSIHYQKEKGIERTTDLYFMSIVESDTGDLWMATYDDGVWRKTENEFIHYPIKDGDIDVLLFSIYKDRQEGLWLTTHNAGIYKYNGLDFERFNP
jgi:ligand-binding sensor domain-containing protein